MKAADRYPSESCWRRGVVRAEGVSSAILSGPILRMWCTKTALLVAPSLYLKQI